MVQQRLEEGVRFCLHRRAGWLPRRGQPALIKSPKEAQNGAHCRESAGGWRLVCNRGAREAAHTAPAHGRMDAEAAVAATGGASYSVKAHAIAAMDGASSSVKARAVAAMGGASYSVKAHAAVICRGDTVHIIFTVGHVARCSALPICLCDCHCELCPFVCA